MREVFLQQVQDPANITILTSREQVASQIERERERESPRFLEFTSCELGLRQENYMKLCEIWVGWGDVPSMKDPSWRTLSPLIQIASNKAIKQRERSPMT